MRLAFIEPEVPNREFSTVSYAARLFIDALTADGHEVHAVLPLPQRSMISDEVTRARWIQELEDAGVPVTVVPGDPPEAPFHGRMAWRKEQARRLLRPRVGDYFAHVALAPAMAQTLDAIEPDVLFIWGGYEGIAATHEAVTAPRFAFMGDPAHLPDVYRRSPPLVGRGPRLTPPHALFRLEAWRKSQMMTRMLARCDAVAATSSHHAAWFRRHGVGRCQYLHNMVPDWGGPKWMERRLQEEPSGKFKILLMGHVGGTATLAGLYLLADEVLPALEHLLGSGFEVHVCGRGELPADLAAKLDRPSVRMRGYVDDIVTEIRSSDIFLVPTPIKLGVRVRIPYAWSVGACVVAHRANSQGLPELRDQTNALLASDGLRLARAIARAYHDAPLRSGLISEGRTTYEAEFSRDAVYPKILAELDRIAVRRLHPGNRIAKAAA